MTAGEPFTAVDGEVGSSAVGASASRPLPLLPRVPAQMLRRPISFVTVHFSDDLQHNLLRSPCIDDPFNELIVVDNRGNLRFDTLGKALLHGIAQARHDLVVAVHEDVYLLPGWQQAFEYALDRLDAFDPDWAFAGSVGWTDTRRIVGHWSDPRGCRNLLEGAPFAPVTRLDEQLLALRPARGLLPDPRLPSIHNIGRDLPRTAARAGSRSYALDAPTVHKFADGQGRPILSAEDSPKIRNRTSRTYLADRACSDAYLQRKWNEADEGYDAAADAPGDDAPLLLLARGGGGSRLLSALVSDAGVFIGNDVSLSGDCLELVDAVYRLALGELRYADAELDARHRADLLAAARAMRRRGGNPAPWGFKLPELLLAPATMLQVFPRARVVHLLRDPLATCLRRTHMTARFDNQVGQAALVAAYRHAGVAPSRILDDSPAMRMALTTRHQIETTLAALAPLPPSRCLTLRFEDLLQAPADALATCRDWLGADAPSAPQPRPNSLVDSIDLHRAARPQVTYDADTVATVAQALRSLRTRLGYAD